MGRGLCAALQFTPPSTSSPPQPSPPLPQTSLAPCKTLAGTPGYMSPEILGQFFAEDPSCTAKYDGTKADIYSAGVMLCVLILRSMVGWRLRVVGAGEADICFGGR